MGIKCEKLLPTGFSVSYWRIRVVFITDEKTEFLVEGYKDKLSREKGRNSCIDESFSVSFDDSPLREICFKNKGDSPKKLGYKYLKTLDFFKGAIDE